MTDVDFLGGWEVAGRCQAGKEALWARVHRREEDSSRKKSATAPPGSLLQIWAVGTELW